MIYETNFALKKLHWKSDVLCYTAFGIILNFSLLSPIILCFMALSRLMIVIHPMDTMFKHNRFVLHCIGTLLGISLFCSTGFTIILEVTSHTIPTVLCSPFFDPTDSILVIKVIIWIVVVLQLSALLLIILTYTK